MPWTSPLHVPQLPFQPPDTLPIHEFLFKDGDDYGCHSKSASKPPFTCGTTGKAYSVSEVAERIEHLARALSRELGWGVNAGDEMDKVIGIFSHNSIDSLVVSWAAHRLSGVSCPISVFYSPSQLADQLSFVRCKALFTCTPLLANALQAAATANIPRSHVFLLPIAEELLNGVTKPIDIKSVDQLIEEGSPMPSLPNLKWAKGQGARQTAFLITSSGTSGLPKNVRISHRNVIAHTIQFATFESMYRSATPQMVLGLLPQSHAYALLLISHASVYNGDGVVVMQGFDLNDTLRAIQKFRIARLYIVPSIIVAITKAADVVKQYDLTSVDSVVFGASPLSMETISLFSDLLPGCSFLQGYGLTETCCIVTFTSPKDAVFGSCGNLMPGVEGRLTDKNGQEISEYNTPGELFLRSPSVALGYYGNEEASKNMITEDGWLRTGDLVEFRKSPGGYDHLYVIDRLKELIKVRGMQVAPAELENFLLQHPKVADASVIPIPDESAGELPRAYIVRSRHFIDENHKTLEQQLHFYVNNTFPQYKHLAGGIEFVDSLPKTPSGKTQRMVLKERAQASVRMGMRSGETHQKSKNSAMHIIEFDSDEDYDA